MASDGLLGGMFLRIVVFSDSHGHYGNMGNIAKKEKNASLFVHLGDGERDTVGFDTDIPTKEYICVRGNCDTGHTPTERLLEFSGKRLFITHGHMYGVKDGLERLTYRALELNADVVLFGHTHEGFGSYDSARKLYLLNPGSISLPKYGKSPTYGVVELTASGVVTSVVKVRTGLFKL